MKLTDKQQKKYELAKMLLRAKNLGLDDKTIKVLKNKKDELDKN